MITKADRIRALLAAGKTPNQIAAEVGCNPAYVRTVRQRDLAGGTRPCDARWLEDNMPKRRMIQRAGDKRRMADPAYRARERAKQRVRDAARRARRKIEVVTA